MTEIFSWVRGIVFYLIFVSLLYQLLPGEKYKKYVHVCAGMIFVLVVMSPLLRLFHVNDRLAYYTSLENLKIAVRDAGFNWTQTDLTGITSSENTDATAYATDVDNQKLDAVWAQYKSSIEKEVFAQFEGAKVYPLAVSMTIDEDESSDSYGRVLQLSVTVTDDATQLSQAVSPVDSVDIHVEVGDSHVEVGDSYEKTENDYEDTGNTYTETVDTHAETVNTHVETGDAKKVSNTHTEAGNTQADAGNTANIVNTSDTTNTVQRSVERQLEAELERIKENIAQKLNMSTENIDIIIA